MQVRTDRDLGTIIRDRRKSLGLDQATLAAPVGVSRQWVVEVEKGKARAEVGLALRTLRVLGLELRATVAGSAQAGTVSAAGLIDIDSVVDRAREPRSDE